MRCTAVSHFERFIYEVKRYTRSHQAPLTVFVRFGLISWIVLVQAERKRETTTWMVPDARHPVGLSVLIS
jgi:hypothetical protein